MATNQQRRILNPKKIKVPGVKFAGVSSGVKGKKKKDLALLLFDRPAKAVAFFTKNQVQAASILQGKQAIKDGRLQAIVVNSGNANAVTGSRGLKNCLRMAAEASRLLGIPKRDVLVSSTGKIGVQLDMRKVLRGILLGSKALSEKGLSHAAEAILTTDQFVKAYQLKGTLRGKSFHLTGIAKGAGMIEPNMGTMLAYLFTDLDLALPLMRNMFFRVVAQTFNAISVDGDTSTNDTVVFMANGSSGISLKTSQGKDLKRVEENLLEVCRYLALSIVRDGEGATKAVEVRVRGAKSNKAAKKIAYSIARSPLVKTSFFGEDPNWGRVICAVGHAGESLDPSKVDISYGPVPLLRRGRPVLGPQPALARKIMKKPSFSVTVDLRQGPGEWQVYTSDLTYEYVRINAEYST